MKISFSSAALLVLLLFTSATSANNEISTKGLSVVLDHTEARRFVMSLEGVTGTTGGGVQPFSVGNFSGWHLNFRLILKDIDYEQFHAKTMKATLSRLETEGFFVWGDGSGRNPLKYDYQYGWTNGTGYIHAWLVPVAREVHLVPVDLLPDEAIVVDFLMVLAEVDYTKEPELRHDLIKKPHNEDFGDGDSQPSDIDEESSTVVD